MNQKNDDAIKQKMALMRQQQSQQLRKEKRMHERQLAMEQFNNRKGTQNEKH